MIPDKELKKKYKVIYQKEPEKYYPVKTLKKLGYSRHKCEKCGTFFWSVKERKTCGDASCIGGFQFIGKKIGNKLSYTETWKKFSEILEKRGYKPIKRYPVVARWNPTSEFTIASISDFQPYVVSGEIDPPENPLTVPQFCLRFGDIDNVGITGSHFTGFVMMGQHAFVKPKDYHPDKYLEDINFWLTKGIGLKQEEIIFHEDSWAGGGNFGPALEFFAYGLEVGNQVYMQFEQTEKGFNELNIKVLDMGEGQERVPWLTSGESTCYEAVFPKVMKYLKEKTGIKEDKKLLMKFLPYSGLLNIDEVENIEKVWTEISEKIKEEVISLKKKILPLAALYSVAEHARALLFALTDSGLPSNTGGGYNLRILFRRAQGFIDKYNWKISIPEICEIHADELKPQFPELKESINNIKKILENEKEKYYAQKEKARRIIDGLADKKEKISTEKLIELYESQGIAPELIVQKTGIKIPENFYAMVSEKHESKEWQKAIRDEKILDAEGLPETEKLWFKSDKLVDFNASVLKVEGKNIVLDKTAFYPEQGGQIQDSGYIMFGKKKYPVKDLKRQGKIIIHVLENSPEFKKGDKVEGHIDFAKRLQLMQHHTGVHIVNGAAQKILGSHVWQAGSYKDEEKARLDITHYKHISKKEKAEIEKLANTFIQKNIPVEKEIYDRNIAEAKFGFRIYQGGAVPGNKIRIVNVPNVDVEACGGTHLDLTGEVEQIKIKNIKKLQDGIIRIEFVAGKAAINYIKQQQETAKRYKSLAEKIAGEKTSLSKQIKKILDDIHYEDVDILSMSEIISVQENHLIDAVEKFWNEYTDYCRQNEEISKKLKISFKHPETEIENFEELSTDEFFAKSLFEHWKEERKAFNKLNESIAEQKMNEIKEGSVVLADFDFKTMRAIAEQKKTILILNKSGDFVFRGPDEKFAELQKLGAKGGGNDIKQGKLPAEKTGFIEKNFKF